MIKLEILNDPLKDQVGTYFIEPDLAQKLLTSDLQSSINFNGLVKNYNNKTADYKRLSITENTEFTLQRTKS